MTSFLWISEADVAELVGMGDAIDALESGLIAEAQGVARNMLKTHVIWNGRNTLHAIGAAFPEAGFTGTKTWAHTEGGATPLLILFDSETGAVKAIIEAFVLGQLRTGAISGVATKYLARADASRMALIGTGKQAMAQLAAVAAVRDLSHVTVWSRTETKKRDFVTRARAELALPVEAAGSLEEAFSGADIITLATRATTPFLSAAAAVRGSHINAVGAITPERAEFEPALLSRARIACADSVEQVRKLSSEFRSYYGDDETAWQNVKPLSALVAAAASRPGDADLTLFKAMGMGISDIALAMEIYRRAVARGLGRALPHPVKAKPRLSARGAH